MECGVIQTCIVLYSLCRQSKLSLAACAQCTILAAGQHLVSIVVCGGFSAAYVTGFFCSKKMVYTVPMYLTFPINLTGVTKYTGTENMYKTNVYIYDNITVLYRCITI